MRSVLAIALVLAWTAACGAGGADEVDGDDLFATHCAKCHGPDGRGDTPVGRAMKVPTLLTARWAAPDAVPALVEHARSEKHAPRVSQVGDAELEAIAHAIQALAAAAAPE